VIVITQKITTPNGLDEAAAVYYDAFALKLEHLELLTPSRERAIRLLSRSMRPELGFFALMDGRVAGVAGMQRGDGPRFYRIGLAAWTAEFGRLGGWRRFLWHRFGQQFARPKQDEVRVDGIAVAQHARGRGIGSQLMAAVEGYARDHGFRAVVLEVVDTNPDAQRLYARLGYGIIKVEQYGRWAKPAGFNGATYMRKALV
jgi:ribosomal protein S18 acetylase RimI-like enzyme